MRTFLRAHWKAIVAIVLLVLLATVTVDPGAAAPELPLSARLRAHTAALASGGRDTATPAQPGQAARYIEQVLKAEGYAVRRQAYRAGGQKLRNIEVSLSNVAPDGKPARIFIVGAQCTGADMGSGSAAVLELARLLKDMRPSQGTEVKFVFFADADLPWTRGEESGSAQPAESAPVLETVGWYTQQRRGRSPDSGSFIAFVGSLASSRQVQDALSAFRPVSDFPAHGLAAPAYVQGVTLLSHSSYSRFGYPAIMITDTGFMRYPYYKMAADGASGAAPEQPDYESTARVVQGLARTITALASGQQG